MERKEKEKKKRRGNRIQISTLLFMNLHLHHCVHAKSLTLTANAKNGGIIVKICKCNV